MGNTAPRQPCMRLVMRGILEQATIIRTRANRRRALYPGQWLGRAAEIRSTQALVITSRTIPWKPLQRASTPIDSEGNYRTTTRDFPDLRVTTSWIAYSMATLQIREQV